MISIQLRKEEENTMQVLYKSTRGNGEELTASQAILKGLAEDGGLFVPTSIPVLETCLLYTSYASLPRKAKLKK